MNWKEKERKENVKDELEREREKRNWIYIEKTRQRDCEKRSERERHKK